ncbi:hypothetical protein J4405_03000 [Candidatus Woesearchaeota archaeon]|nr:hypothetical protein [Candidatus Woesearchaeota archaeon]
MSKYSPKRFELTLLIGLTLFAGGMTSSIINTLNESRRVKNNLAEKTLTENDYERRMYMGFGTAAVGYIILMSGMVYSIKENNNSDENQ